VVFIPLKTESEDYVPAQMLTMKTVEADPQGRVVIQLAEDKCHKSSASEGLHMYGV
jgi:hypothetical protein